MSEFHKVIKYLAIAFAIFLTVTILTGIGSGVVAIVGVTSVKSGKEENMIDFNKDFENVKSITVGNGVGKLNIKPTDSDKITVEAVNVFDSFYAEKSNNGELKIESKFNFWNIFNSGQGFNQKSSITIYLPTSFKAKRFRIDAGAGNVNIDGLATEDLDINAGVGDVYGENIYADEVSLDGGVGNITLSRVELNDAHLNAGVGNIDIQGILTGSSKIDAGVGNIKMDITQSIDKYKFKIDKGVGDIYINGDKYSHLNSNNSNAEYYLDINGGVGNIKANFRE